MLVEKERSNRERKDNARLDEDNKACAYPRAYE
jgi:hypothetical protein